jgi:AcrR family transcriptional regulator
MKNPITPETQAAVLNAAWDLMSRHGRMDVGMAEIAAAAGVSRQTVFYAFGGRAKLLVAMVRHKDTQGDHVARLMAVAQGAGADIDTLLAFADAWLDYLPVIYPVAIQLETASLTDPDVAEAWRDRIFGNGLRLGLDRILGRIAKTPAWPRGRDPKALADLCLTLLVPSTWRYLVVERGWSPADYAASRHALLRAALAAS